MRLATHDKARYSCSMRTHLCSSCKKSKPRKEFYADRSNPGGLVYMCKPCYGALRIERLKNPAVRLRTRTYSREYAHRRLKSMSQGEIGRFKAQKAKYDRAYQASGRRKYDAYKRRAHQALMRAVDNGTISRPSGCQECGWVGKPEGHHHKGYDTPLDVEWLCRICHAKRHRLGGGVIRTSKALGRKGGAK